MEDDYQTGVFTEKLIKELGLSPQRIVRMAIADLYEKHQAETTKNEIGSLGELISCEQPTNIIEELIPANDENIVNPTNLEVMQRELETLWQRDTEEYDCEEYLEEPEESNIDFEEDEIEAVESKLAGMFGTNQVPATDAEVLADILRKASDYSSVRRGLWQYQQAKEEAWNLLSDSERKSVWQMLPEAIKKLSNAKREGLIVNFYEMESGGLYKVFTTDYPLIEETVSNSRLDRWLADLKVRQNSDCN